MRALMPTLPLTALALAAGALPAPAQVAPEDVWAAYRDFYAATGLQVTAAESRAGDTLTLRDITATALLPEGLGAVSLLTGPVDLVDLGDGTVSVVYPATSAVRMSGILGPAGEVTFDMILTGTQDSSVTASGTPDDIVIFAETGATAFTLTDLTLTGAPELEAVTADSVSLGVELTGAQGVTRLRRGDGVLTMEVQSLTGSSSYGATIDMMELAGVYSENSGGTQTSQFLMTLALPEGGVNYLDLATAIRAGLALELVSRTEGITASSLSRMPDGTESRQESVTASSDSVLRLGPAGLEIAAGSTGAEVRYEEIDGLLPFPLAFAAQAASFSLGMPLLADGAPQTARIALGIDGLAVDERLFRLFDPSELMLRDPLSLQIDLSAEVRLLSDLVDFLTIGQMIESNTPPFEVDSVTLTAGNVSAVGVTLESSGSFTLDFDDMTSFDGFPRPEGSATASASGIDGLLDTLLTMGLLSPEDAMGARMGLGMFTDVTGEDSVGATLEVTPDGQVIVNGNRIR